MIVPTRQSGRIQNLEERVLQHLKRMPMRERFDRGIIDLSLESIKADSRPRLRQIIEHSLDDDGDIDPSRLTDEEKCAVQRIAEELLSKRTTV